MFDCLWLRVTFHRPAGYQGGSYMLGIGPGGPYNHPPSNSSARMTPQGPSYNTMPPTGKASQFALIWRRMLGCLNVAISSVWILCRAHDGLRRCHDSHRSQTETWAQGGGQHTHHRAPQAKGMIMSHKDSCADLYWYNDHLHKKIKLNLNI